MYSKQQASQLKNQFWTAFGEYMQPVLSAEGIHINWLNYKTGEKDIYFRMHADNKKASVAIELTHADCGLQTLFFQQFQQLQTILHNILYEEWTWLLHTHDEHGKLVSMIFKEIENISIFDKATWPQLISFFKPRIMALDEYWANAKGVFETMH